jgi:hypothetical protein
VAIGGGVLWSNALAYHTVWLAPRPRLTELAKIGHRFAGDGPTLVTDTELYGVRYFLRSMAPDGVSIFGSRPITFVQGGTPADGENVDVDRIKLESLLVYQTLVLRRSPVASRPPSAFTLAWSGRYYEVWQQNAGAPKILRHLPLGNPYQPAATSSCSTVLRLEALAARNGGRLATVSRPPVVVRELSQPGGPVRPGEDPSVAYLGNRFTLPATMTIPPTGRYGVWVGGSFRARLEVWVDGRLIGAQRDQPNWPGDFTRLGGVPLRAGPHTVTVHYSGPDVFHPGSAGQPPFGTGPLVLAQGTADRPVRYVQPQDARTLCGKRLDWIEAVTL